jgi:hypothetical protein
MIMYFIEVYNGCIQALTIALKEEGSVFSDEIQDMKAEPQLNM